MHAAQDVNVTLAHAMRFCEALVQASKHHDLLLQNQGHRLAGQRGEFAQLKAARFFTRHLGHSA